MDARAIFPSTQAYESKFPVKDDWSDADGPEYSAQAPQGMRGGLTAALVGTLAACACGRLQQMGHRSVVFSGASDLLAASKSGHHFDLVLLSLQDEGEVVGKGTFATFEALDMPVLLLAQEGKWGELLSRIESSAWCEILEFDIFRTTNEELDWRIHAVHRRMRDVARKQCLTSARTRVGIYQFFDDNLSVVYRDHKVVLQPRQYQFAFELFKNFGRLLTRDQLFSSLWRTAPRVNGARAIDACASKLRTKLQLRGENGVILRAVYGEGYKLVSTAHTP